MRHILTSCLLVVALTNGMTAPNKAPAPAPAANGNRFLFVVETATPMLAFEHAGRQAAFDLLYFGINDQIQPGDTIGLWTFGDSVQGGVFPMQVWVPDENLQLASRAGLFLKNQPCQSQARLDRVVTKLLSLVRAVKDVNILIISDSEQTWKGTAFDYDLNLAFQKNRPASHTANKPLVTTLIARNGAITNWSVTVAGEPIVIPKPTVPEKVLQVAKAQNSTSNSPSAGSDGTNLGNGAVIAQAILPGPTNSVPLAAAPVDNAPPLPPTPVNNDQSHPAARVKSIVITSKANDVETDANPTDSQNKVIRVASAPTSAPSQSVQAAAEPKRQENAHGDEKTSLASSDAATPALPPKKQIGFPMLTPLPMAVAARERPDAAGGTGAVTVAPSIAMAAQSPHSIFSPYGLFAFAVGLTVGATGLLFFAVRSIRRETRRSFISRSFERFKP